MPNEPNKPADIEFYNRGKGDDVPTISGRKPKPSSKCKLCRLVVKLEEKGYTLDEATEVEKDTYRMIYTFYEATEIANWLWEKHEIDISHDSVSRHIKNCISDPHIMFLERVKTYRPKYMRKQQISSIMDTMVMLMLKFREDLMEGAVEIKPSDFARVSEMYKDWTKEDQENMEEVFMAALNNALTEVFDEDQQEMLKRSLRKHLEEFEGNDQ